jgi:Tfp pilus assembly protein PilO
MDQFMKLPPAQKAAVFAGILVVLALGLYFGLVDPELGKADQARAQLKKLDNDVKTLKSSASAEAADKLRKEKDELVEEDKKRRAGFPSADEIPKFIDAVQADAANIHLMIKRFDRLQEESEDLYNAIPIKVTLEGSVQQLIEFLRLYAGMGRRLINIRGLTIETLVPDAGLIRTAYDAAHKPVEGEKKHETNKSPEAALYEKFELADMSRDRTTIRATFTAYAFVWTGKPAELKEGMARRDKPKKKRT